MIKSKSILVIIPILLLAAVAALKPGIPQAGMQKLQGFSATAKYWTAVSHFGSNYSGYQASSADWTQQALHSDR